MKIRHWMLLGLVALLAGVSAYWVLAPREKIADYHLQGATLLPQAKALPAFQLIDQKGQPFSNKQLQRHWTWLFFGFTHCPDVCPATLALLNQTFQKLPANHLQAPLQIVMVTVDPKRDNPQALKNFLAKFNPHYIGLTGNKKTLAQLRQFFGVAVQRKPKQIQHTASVFLINPAGEWQGLFSPPIKPSLMLADFLNIVDETPAVSLPKQVHDIHQRPIQLSATKQWLVINYWASWCTPCYKEMPILNRLYQHYRNQVMVVGVNYDGMALSEQRAFAQKHHITYPLLAMDPGRTYGVKNIQYLPATFIITPKGKIKSTLFGPQSFTQLKQVLTLS